MNSPFANLYELLHTRLSANLTKTESRYIDLDIGQMENYDPNKPGSKPSISLPAQLIDFETTNFTNEGELRQRGETIILLRTCMEQISPSDRLTPTQWRQKGLAYLETEWKINKLLHGWTPGDGYGHLIRIGAVTENRPDNYRVRQLRYKLSWTDKSCQIPLPTVASAYLLEPEYKKPEEEE